MIYLREEKLRKPRLKGDLLEEPWLPAEQKAPGSPLFLPSARPAAPRTSSNRTHGPVTQPGLAQSSQALHQLPPPKLGARSNVSQKVTQRHQDRPPKPPSCPPAPQRDFPGRKTQPHPPHPLVWMEKGKLMSNPPEFLAKEQLWAHFDDLPPWTELGRPLDPVASEKPPEPRALPASSRAPSTGQHTADPNIYLGEELGAACRYLLRSGEFQTPQKPTPAGARATARSSVPPGVTASSSPHPHRHPGVPPQPVG